MPESTLGLLFEIGADASKAESALGSFTGVTTRQLAILTGAITGAAATLFAIAKKTAYYGEEMLAASQRTGMAVEQISALKFAAEQSETSFEALTRGIQFAARNLSGLSEKASPAEKAMKALGIETRDADAHVRPLHDLLLAVASRFSKLKDGAEKTAFAMAIFGRGGAALVPLLNQGREGIEQLEGQARKLGITFDEKTARAADAFNDQLNVLQQGVKGFTFQVGNALIPVLLGWSTWLESTGLKIAEFKSRLESLGYAFIAVAKFSTFQFKAAGDFLTLAREAADEAAAAETRFEAAVSVTAVRVAAALKGQADSRRGVAGALIDEAAAAKAAAAAYEKLCRQLEWIDSVRRASAGTMEKAKKVEQDFAKIGDAGAASMARLNQATIRTAAVLTEHWGKMTRGPREFRDELTSTEIAMLQIGDTFTTITDHLDRALSASIAGAMIYGKSIGEAIRVALKSTLTSIAVESAVRALFELAKAFSCMFWNPAEANAHFIAAAMFGKTAALAGVGAALVPGGYTTATRGAGAAGGPAGGAAMSPPTLAPGAAGGGRFSEGGVTVIFQGPVYGGKAGIHELVTDISQAVERQGARLISTESKGLRGGGG